MQKEIDKLKGAIDAAKAQKDEIEKEANALADQLENGNLTPEEKRDALDALKDNIKALKKQDQRDMPRMAKKIDELGDKLDEKEKDQLIDGAKQKQGDISDLKNKVGDLQKEIDKLNKKMDDIHLDIKKMNDEVLHKDKEMDKEKEEEVIETLSRCGWETNGETNDQPRKEGAASDRRVHGADGEIVPLADVKKQIVQDVNGVIKKFNEVKNAIQGKGGEEAATGEKLKELKQLSQNLQDQMEAIVDKYDKALVHAKDIEERLDALKLETIPSLRGKAKEKNDMIDECDDLFDQLAAKLDDQDKKLDDELKKVNDVIKQLNKIQPTEDADDGKPPPEMTMVGPDGKEKGLLPMAKDGTIEGDDSVKPISAIVLDENDKPVGTVFLGVNGKPLGQIPLDA